MSSPIMLLRQFRRALTVEVLWEHIEETPSDAHQATYLMMSRRFYKYWGVDKTRAGCQRVFAKLRKEIRRRPAYRVCR